MLSVAALGRHPELINVGVMETKRGLSFLEDYIPVPPTKPLVY